MSDASKPYKEVSILLVDDDREIVTALRTVLESRGYRVLTAFDGNAALNNACSRTRDCALLR